MAAILQFRQGSKSSFISSGPFISEPFFDTDTNIIHIGVSGSSTITLTKLEDINSGSFSVSGDISGSNLYLSGDITASNTLLSGDITIGGNIILGDQVQDTITISGQFDSNLIPSASEQYDIGSQTKKWNHLYALSASIDSIDLLSNLPSGIVSSSNQIDTGSIHFQRGVELYSINGINPASGIIGSADSLGVKIRGLSADGLSFDGPGNLIIDTGSDYFVSGAQEASLLGLPQGTVSGSEQVIGHLPAGTVSGSSQVLDGTNIVSSSVQVIDFLPSGTISGSTQILDGSGILSSSNTQFEYFSESIDSSVTDNLNFIQSLNAVSHSHSNKNLLDTINQNLSTTGSVQFYSLQTTTEIEVDGDIEVLGTASFDGDVTIYGDLSVFGTQSIINSTNLAIADNMIYLNSGSTITNPDLGFAGNYNDGTYAHAGLFRDASDGGIWKFYQGYTPEPEGSVDTSHASFELAPIKVESVNAVEVTAGDFIGTGSLLNFDGTNIVSSSQQVIDFLPGGTVSGSTQITDGSNLVSSSQQVINFLPTGTISGSNQVLGGTDIVSSSIQVIELLPTDTVSGSQQVIDFLPNGTISGSDQVTQSLDTRYLEIDGDNVLSSSNENFTNYSQSVDLRLLNTLTSGSETSQSLHILVGNFPTSGSLGTSAFYNVSSSLADDPDAVPTIKAVFDYINNTIGAADITGVSASLGLSGGGDAGYVSLSLDTGSTHFQEGVELYGTSQVEVVNILNDNNILSGSYLGTATTSNLTEGSNLYYTTNRVQSYLDSIGVISSSNGGETITLGQITGSDILSTGNVFADGYIQSEDGLYVGINGGQTQFSVNQTGDTVIRGTLEIGSAVGGITDVSASISSIDVLNTTQNNRLDSLELISSSLDSNVSTSEIIIKNTDGAFTGSNSYADSNNLSVGTDSPSNLGATQLTINDYGIANTSGILSFEDSGSTKSFDYVLSNNRYIDTAGGVQIVLKPDADANKSWVIDTDGDLVSNGGSWASGNAYMNNLIASSSVTASNMIITNDVIISGDLTASVISGGSGGLNIDDSVSIDIHADGIGAEVNISSVNSSDIGFSGTTDITSGRFLNLRAHAGSPSITSQIDLTSQIEITSDNNITIDSQGEVRVRGTGITAGTDASPAILGIGTSGRLQTANVTSSLDSHYVKVDGNQTIGGTKTFDNVIVNGTGSFAYLESVTGSAKIIGDAYIVLNNNTPTERYAGVKVYDSGSLGVTSSLEFDGDTNDWFYEYSDDGGVTAEHGVVMFGPEYNTKGAPTYNTSNTILKSNGGHHTLDSNITDNGSLITLGSNTTVSGTISGSNIHSEGTVTAEGDIVAYASSDRRLKENIRPIPFAIDKINQIGGYSFDWNNEKQHIYKGKDYGVIAQEIEEVLPELVQNRENGYKAVKYDKLVSLLIEGIKELSQEVKELREKINRE